jgi:hypothetical protein
LVRDQCSAFLNIIWGIFFSTNATPKINFSRKALKNNQKQNKKKFEIKLENFAG